jgi:SAM-dependent MidA family methyltransferase
VKGHAYADVLAAPGEADVTSHVDFTALGDALRAGGAGVLPVATQGAFLNDLGAFERTAALKRVAGPAQVRELDAAYARLTAPEAMGTLFKAVCAYSPASLQPVGFATA